MSATKTTQKKRQPKSELSIQPVVASPQSDFPIVGIGASAGGQEALGGARTDTRRGGVEGPLAACLPGAERPRLGGEPALLAREFNVMLDALSERDAELSASDKE